MRAGFFWFKVSFLISFTLSFFKKDCFILMIYVENKKKKKKTA